MQTGKATSTDVHKEWPLSASSFRWQKMAMRKQLVEYIEAISSSKYQAPQANLVAPLPVQKVYIPGFALPARQHRHKLQGELRLRRFRNPLP